MLLVVEDDGPGIPDELHEAVFEPFRQAPGLVVGTRPASAWGLSLVGASPSCTAAAPGSRIARAAARSFRVFLPAA